MKLSILAVLAVFICTGWNDHPDREDHKYSDLLFKLAELQSLPDEQKTPEHKDKEKKIASTLAQLKNEELPDENVR